MARSEKILTDELRKRLRKLRGRIRTRRGGKSFAKWWREHKTEEMALEDAKLERLPFRRSHRGQDSI